jgi:hypothetical protein
MHTNPFQALLNDYHQDREKQAHHNFIEEEKRRHASHHLQGRGAEWRTFLVGPRRAASRASSSSCSSLRCWPATMTPDTSASPRGLHLPVFSFDAIHRPFCASPPTTTMATTSWTPAPPSSTPWSSSSSSSASSSSWSLQPPSRVHADVSAPPRPPRRGRLVLPALADPEPAARREEAANVVSVGESSSSSPAAAVAEESADCALLSLVTLSCSTSPAASPVRQPSTRLLRAASACETFATELRKKKRKREDAAHNNHDELTGRPPRSGGGLQGGVDHGDNEDAEMRRHAVVVAGDRAHKRRRVERLMSVGQAHDGDDEEENAAGRAIDGERPQEVQGTEDSDVEADHHENEADHSNGGAQDDVGSEAAGEDHYDERGLGILMLGEESANEEEDNDNDDEQDALDESRRQHQHQHQKTVMEMEMVTETTSPHPPPASGRRGPRRIWASISARELEGLRLYAPMPTGSRRTRVSRMGLHHFFHRAHPARGPSTLAS